MAPFILCAALAHAGEHEDVQSLREAVAPDNSILKISTLRCPSGAGRSLYPRPLPFDQLAATSGVLHRSMMATLEEILPGKVRKASKTLLEDTAGNPVMRFSKLFNRYLRLYACVIRKGDLLIPDGPFIILASDTTVLHNDAESPREDFAVKIVGKGSVKDGIVDGSFVAYNAAGQPLLQKQFKNGLQDGQDVSRSGKVITTRIFKDGLPTGEHKIVSGDSVLDESHFDAKTRRLHREVRGLDGKPKLILQSLYSRDEKDFDDSLDYWKVLQEFKNEVEIPETKRDSLFKDAAFKKLLEDQRNYDGKVPKTRLTGTNRADDQKAPIDDIFFDALKRGWNLKLPSDREIILWVLAAEPKDYPNGVDNIRFLRQGIYDVVDSQKPLDEQNQKLIAGVFLNRLPDLVSLNPDAKDDRRWVTTELQYFKERGASIEPIIREHLTNERPEVRSLMLESIAETKPFPEHMLSEIRKATKDTDATVRNAALQVLTSNPKNLDSEKELFIAALGDPSEIVRRTAANILYSRVKGGETAVGALLKQIRIETDKETRSALVGALSRTSPGSVAAFAESVRIAKDPADPANQNAARLLHEFGPRAVPVLTEILRSPDSSDGVLLNSLRSLGELKQKAALSTSTVTALLTRDSHLIRWESATLLATFGPLAHEAVPALIEAAKKETDNGVLLTELQALGKIGPAAKAAIPLLEKLSADKDTNTAGWARNSLANMGPTAIPALIKILERSSDETGAQIVILNAFEKYGPDSSQALPSLLKFLESNDEGVQGAALKALGAMASRVDIPLKSVSDLLTSHRFYVRHSAATALGGFGPKAKATIPDLVALMRAEEIPLRKAAARSLLKIDPAGGVDLVRKEFNRLRSPDIGEPPDYQNMRYELASLLSTQKDPAIHKEIIPVLEDALKKEDHIVQVGLKGLANLREGRAILEKRLDSGNPDARFYAAIALVSSDATPSEKVIRILQETADFEKNLQGNHYLQALGALEYLKTHDPAFLPTFE